MAVGSTAAIVGASVAVASAVVSSSVSGAKSAKAKKAAQQAEKVAAKKMEEARKEIERMPMQELGLNLDVYKQSQEASQVAAAMSLDAAQQADQRGLAAAAGRTQMADIANQRQTSLDQASALQKLEMVKAQERQQASDKLANLSLEEAAGAQMAAAESEQMAASYENQAIQSGMQAVTSAAQVAGAATQGKMSATQAYKENIASIGDASIADFMAQDVNYLGDASKLQGDDLMKEFLKTYDYRMYTDPKFQERLSGNYYRAKQGGSTSN